MTADDAQPCLECPQAKLAEYLDSPPGKRLAIVIDLDFALQVGFHLTLADVSFYEFRLLRLLAEERRNWESEEIRKNRGG